VKQATEQKDRGRDEEGIVMTRSITVTHTGTLHGSEALSADYGGFNNNTQYNTNQAADLLWS